MMLIIGFIMKECHDILKVAIYSCNILAFQNKIKSMEYMLGGE